MILFLDDDPQRAVMAYDRMPEADRPKTIWCQTAEEAITTLRDYELERVHLDHDLGGETYVNTKREDCGMEVVRYLEKRAHKDPKWFEKFATTKFIIHSWNTHAGPLMVERLEKLGLNVEYKPFGM